MLRGEPERDFADALRRLLSTSHDILDVGTSRRFAKTLKPYKHLFANKHYIAAGYEPVMKYGEDNCDCHQDIQDMTFEDASFDAIICIEVLEHVADPFRAVREIKRVLRPGGTLLLTVPFLLQYHGKSGKSASHEEYPDYWRFTHQGLELLFDDFTDVRVTPLNGPVEFRLRQTGAGSLLKLPVVRTLLDRVDPRAKGRATTRHMLVGTK